MKKTPLEDKNQKEDRKALSFNGTKTKNKFPYPLTGFTPLEIKRPIRKRIGSLTGFTPLEKKRPIRKRIGSLTGFTRVKYCQGSNSAKRNYLTGFTLIEILVAIIAMFIVISIVFAGYKDHKEEVTLRLVADALASDIRRAELMVGTDNTYCSDDYKYAYGVMFDTDNSDRYIIFSDCNDNGRYEEGSDGLIETIYLAEGIKIKELSPILPGVEYQVIVFSPPFFSVLINNNPGINTASIKISLEKDESVEKNISINKTGKIEIE